VAFQEVGVVHPFTTSNPVAADQPNL